MIDIRNWKPFFPKTKFSISTIEKVCNVLSSLKYLQKISLFFVPNYISKLTFRMFVSTLIEKQYLQFSSFGYVQYNGEL